MRLLTCLLDEASYVSQASSQCSQPHWSLAAGCAEAPKPAPWSAPLGARPWERAPGSAPLGARGTHGGGGGGGGVGHAREHLRHHDVAPQLQLARPTQPHSVRAPTQWSDPIRKTSSEIFKVLLSEPFKLLCLGESPPSAARRKLRIPRGWGGT